ncbi:helix-turn-helix domain-containing protein [Zavarzinella formosa]|uniref:helix-turn-helix domain-containing protein n=1 Tax=Zavarzinella formosa TaxID=360055 RepID=UPI000309348D|nr:helix-turn-helix domain-containing protein [Zavarzinella formosa]
MSARTTLVFSDDVLAELSRERYDHPDPHVQRRMEVLWLIGHGETQVRAGELAGVSKATVARHIALFRREGPDGLRRLGWHKPESELERHRTTLENEFRERPPHTVAEAADRIRELTGLRRGETQVRKFLKKTRLETPSRGGGPFAAEKDGRGARGNAGRFPA